jgi:hypothetical protein
MGCLQVEGPVEEGPGRYQRYIAPIPQIFSSMLASRSGLKLVTLTMGYGVIYRTAHACLDDARA